MVSTSKSIRIVCLLSKPHRYYCKQTLIANVFWERTSCLLFSLYTEAGSTVILHDSPFTNAWPAMRLWNGRCRSDLPLESWSHRPLMETPPPRTHMVWSNEYLSGWSTKIVNKVISLSNDLSTQPLQDTSSHQCDYLLTLYMYYTIYVLVYLHYIQVTAEVQQHALKGQGFLRERIKQYCAGLSPHFLLKMVVSWEKYPLYMEAKITQN